MTYYNVFILHKKDDDQETLLESDRSEKRVNMVCLDIINKKDLFFCHRLIKYSNIIGFSIFDSGNTPFRKLKFPDGSDPLKMSNVDIINSFSNGEVEGVTLCTIHFLEKAKNEYQPRSEIKGKMVFIVHGRDQTQALILQKHLAKKGVEAKIFDDFKEESKSRTIIEQLEFIKENVGYAFIMATPDDLGVLKEEFLPAQNEMFRGQRKVEVKKICEMLKLLKTRARQNVVFEFGLFLGSLGRDRVCCLLEKGTQERPSDIEGIIYTGFNKLVKEKFTEIDGKLKTAGILS